MKHIFHLRSNCYDLLSYNSSPRSSHIWFSYIHNLRSNTCILMKCFIDWHNSWKQRNTRENMSLHTINFLLFHLRRHVKTQALCFITGSKITKLLFFSLLFSGTSNNILPWFSNIDICFICTVHGWKRCQWHRFWKLAKFILVGSGKYCQVFPLKSEWGSWAMMIAMATKTSKSTWY